MTTCLQCGATADLRRVSADQYWCRDCLLKLTPAQAFVGPSDEVRVAYHRGVQFIAFNDEDGSADAESVDKVSEQICVVLLAEVFQKTPRNVARDVVMTRTGKKVEP